MSIEGSSSEQDVQKQKEHIAKLRKALNEAKSTLSEIGVMELRRKKSTASAIIQFVQPIFSETLSLEKQLTARQKSRAPWYWVIASGGIGYWLHSSFPPAKVLDFSLGSFVFFSVFILAGISVLNTEKIARALKDSQRALDEMFYRWTANGGNSDRFWELRNQIDVDSGHVDFDTDKYQLWCYEMEADLVDSVNGEVPGIGDWRPRFHI